MLDGLYTPGGEAAAIADALDVVDDGPRGIAGEQEVPVQRVYRPARVDRARRRHQCLTQHLSAEDALPALVAASATKQVVLQRLQVEGGKKCVQRGLRRGIGGGHRGLAMVDGEGGLA